MYASFHSTGFLIPSRMCYPKPKNVRHTNLLIDFASFAQMDRSRSYIYDILMWKRGWRSKNYVNLVVESRFGAPRKQLRFRGGTPTTSRFMNSDCCLWWYKQVKTIPSISMSYVHVSVFIFDKSGFVCVDKAKVREWEWEWEWDGAVEWKNGYNLPK